MRSRVGEDPRRQENEGRKPSEGKINPWKDDGAGGRGRGGRKESGGKEGGRRESGVS